jgi:tetratricopeptide (TPR) repeat protein
MPQGPVISTFKALSFSDPSWILWPDAAALTGNLYFLLLASTVLTFFLIGLSITIKYSAYLLNDFKTISDSSVPDIAIKLWFAMILTLPLFLNAGPLWFTIWWVVIFNGYINMAEKKLVAFLFILFMVSGLLSGIGGKLITYASTQANKEIFLVEENMEAQEDIAYLSTWVNKYEDDSDPANALAISKIRKGEYEDAISLLTRCIKNDPDNPIYYNTMGIVLAAQQKTNEAVTAFENASNLKPREVVYYFNLSRAYLDVFNLFEADKQVEKMTEIDPREASRLLSRNTYPMYVYKKEPLKDMFRRQMRPSTEASLAADELWNSAIGLLKPSWAPWAGIIMLICFLFLGYIPKDKFTKKCSKCGNHFYVGAMTQKGYPLCLQCNLIETRSKKQHNIVVHHKLQEIKNFGILNRRRTTRFEMFLPGLGSLIANRTIRAVAMLFIFSFAITLAISGGMFMYSFMPSGSHYTLYFRLTGIVALVMLYLIAFRYPPVKRGI